jgi:hypothetical protein
MRGNVRLFVIAGLLVGLGLAILVSPFASSQPDGLEKVATEEEFADAAQDHDLADGPLADYGVEGVENERVGTAVAGVIGTLLTFGIGLGLFALVRTLRRRQDGPPPVAA